MEREELIEFLDRWLEAYPYDVFPEPGLREISEGPERTFTREEAVGLATRNAAAMARHVLKRIRRELDPETAG